MERHRAWLLAAVALGAAAAVTALLWCGNPAAPQQAEGLPPGWTAVKRAVAIGMPEGVVQREITYCRNVIGMEFVLVPAGEFMMGRDDQVPQRRVLITRPLLMGACEVTQTQYEAVMGENPSMFNGPDRPVERVTWNDAVEFCRRLGQQTGATIRLPTEAEWEYACRAGTGTSFYRDSPMRGVQVDHDDENDNHGHGGGKTDFFWEATTVLGSSPANPLGLYDMQANVWEWCQDWYGDDYYKDNPAADPQGPETGTFRALRGGPWFGNELACRAAVPTWDRPLKAPNGLVGFRVVVLPRPP